MPPRVSHEQLDFARRLRSDMTAAETALWRGLRSRSSSAKFRRQVPIGPYVADFASVGERLVVELDGRTHESEERRQADVERDAWLAEHGWGVLRMPNDLVLGGGNNALDRIRAALRSFPSSDPR